MKKFFIVALFSALILGFTGCSKSDDSFSHYRNIYGDDCEVYTLSPSYFLISWEQDVDSADIIFSNDKAIEVIDHKGKLDKINYGDSGIQLYFTDDTGYWFE